MTRDLRGLFDPKSIAIIGASDVPTKVGSIALKNIILSGFAGKLYPVNPNVKNIEGLKFYTKVADLPEIPDLAVVAIPAAGVIGVMEECGEMGIKNLLIFSAGFKEIGATELEEKLVETARKYKLNILGPNCLGFASTTPPLNITFGQVVKNPGNLRLITQSGALASSLFDWCESTGLGFTDFVTIGNKSVVNENDVLQYWLPELKKVPEVNLPGASKVVPVGMYLESIAQGEELRKLIGEISPINPVFVLKPGKSEVSKMAMHSHTGAMAGEDRVLEAALAQSGAIRCEELGDFFDLAMAFSWENAPTGPGVAVISNAGGPAVLATDTITKYGLQMAKLGQETKDKLLQFLPRIASIMNPVDVLGDALADRFGQALEVLLQEKTVEAVVVIITPQLMTQMEKTAEIISQMSLKYKQPILCAFVGGNHTTEAQNILYKNKIPVYPFPERAIKAIAAMWQWQSGRTKEITTGEKVVELEKNLAVEKMLVEAIGNKQTTLDNLQADGLMKVMGILTPAGGLVNSIEEANKFVEKNGWPVVLKLSTPGLLHKTEVGGVKVNINSMEKLTEAFEQLQQTKQGKIQIQKQIEGGIEVILGVKRDPTFGTFCLFGAGGKFAELIDDHNLALCPLDTEYRKKLIEKSEIFKLLSGFRGEKPYELDQLYEVVTILGQMMETYPQIEEMEINPLIVTHQGVWAVDPKVILSDNNI